MQLMMMVHDSQGIEIVNFTISLALSAGTLMASAGTPYSVPPSDTTRAQNIWSVVVCGYENAIDLVCGLYIM